MNFVYKDVDNEVTAYTELRVPMTSDWFVGRCQQGRMTLPRRLNSRQRAVRYLDLTWDRFSVGPHRG
jgi:hypothetical protein